MLYLGPKAKISVHYFVNHELVSVKDKFHKRDICNPFVSSTAKEFVKSWSQIKVVSIKNVQNQKMLSG